MKLSFALLGLVAASVMPTATAFAQSPENQPRPFAVRMTSDAIPLAHGAVRYPSGAAIRQIDGDCTVRFDVASGAASGVEVLACSSDHFRSEAQSVVSGLRFDNAPRQDAVMNIAWTMTSPTPGMQTAKLD